MFGTLTTVGLAYLCVAFCASPRAVLPFRTVPGAFMVLAGSSPGEQDTPAEREAPDRAKAAEYRKERENAASRIRSATSLLQDDLKRLLQLKEVYPNDKELALAIAQVRQLLAPFESGGPGGINAVAGAAWGEADLATLASQTQRLSEAAARAENSATQGQELTDRILRRLAPAPRPQIPEGVGPGASAPPPPPPPEPQPKAREGGGSRSPASVPDGSSSGSLPSAREKTESTPPGQPAQQPTDPEAAWYNRLANGLLQYSVPQLMLWKVPSTVTVRINGEKNRSTEAIEGETGQASIKVARRMKVLVAAPDNPDEFVIAPEPDTTLEQYVPEDGPTTWHFSVTPRYTAKEQKLVVQAWVIYDANTQRELPVYRTVVSVHVPSLGECLKRLFQGDPDYWLKYGLPGGAGFVFISGILTGLWKWVRNRKKKAMSPATPGVMR